ncbi:MAG: tetratricopeptide repeat protein [Burkholderiales bacterium]|nr:tetratricopeptide repeat protein [Burkholderiales bacterium]
MSNVAGRLAPDALLAQAVELHRQGRLSEAEPLYRAILAVDPRQPDALHHLGLLGFQAGHLLPAEQLLAKASAVAPGDPVVLNNWGIVLARLGRLAEARSRFEAAVGRSPGYADALVNLANVLADAGDAAAAEQRYREALDIAPDSAEARNNFGRLLLSRKRLPEAIACFEEALRTKPGHALAQNNLGNAYREVGRLEEACRCYREAARLRPDMPEPASNLLVAMTCDPAIEIGEVFKAHVEFAARFEPRIAMPAPSFAPRAPGRLRVGYVSADLRAHAVAAFAIALLEAHDRTTFEVSVYHNAFVEDEFTRRARGAAERFVTVAGLTDDSFVQLVREHRIDVLVDLSGHTADNRLLAFARRAAPVQATWLGYINTTGLAAMDFRITDAQVDPPGATEQWHTETLLRLPASLWCYRSWPCSPDVCPSPGLERGYVTFGSTANPAKLNASLLRAWKRLLGRVPGSRLLVHAPEDVDFRQRILATVCEDGQPEERVAFFPRLPAMEYLRQYADIDICLDSFPCAGATTTLDALWMGVPVVSLAGQAPYSRAGASILTTLGLVECLAHCEDEYVERAAALAADLPALARLRSALRGRLQASPLMDEPGFARAMEAAFAHMCRSKGLAPSPGDPPWPP